MVNRNSFIGRLFSAIGRFDDFLGRVGADIYDFLKDINEVMERSFTVLTTDIPEEISQYKAYRKRICHLCGEKVPAGEGMSSYSSFIIYHDKCFEMARMNQYSEKR